MPRTSKQVKEEAPGRPEFYRLPKTGGDPYFGLTRCHYYQLEKHGKLKLTRLKSPGSSKGVTLVRYSAVLAMIEKAAKEGAKTA